MHEMRWSWEQVRATPPAAKELTLRFLDAVAVGQQAQHDKANSKTGGQRIDITKLEGYEPPPDD